LAAKLSNSSAAQPKIRVFFKKLLTASSKVSGQKVDKDLEHGSVKPIGILKLHGGTRENQPKT